MQRYKEVVRNWNIFYPKLVNYYKIYHHTDLPERWKVDQPLADWVLMVRKGMSSLSKGRKKLLQALNFTSYHDWLWEQSYHHLLSFKKKNGHLRIPSKGPYEMLYNWLLLQKKNKARLSTARLSKLERIGALEDRAAYLDEKWWKRYKELLEYKRRYGDCLVPGGYKKNPSLGKWVVKQRTLYRTGKLLSYRKKLLEEINFYWSRQDHRLRTVFYDKKWEKKYKMLEKYVRDFGHPFVPHEWKPNPSLARWVSDQRMNFSNHKLSEEKIARLNALHFEWKPLEAQWMERFYELKNFYQKHNHTKIPVGGKFHSLAKWVSYMRGRKNEISKEQVALLDTLNFNWVMGKRKIYTWEEMYRKLEMYKKKHGMLPAGKIDDTKLYKWFYDQRTERVKHSPERKALLEKLGMKFREPQ